jgi:hypothetical protein
MISMDGWVKVADFGIMKAVGKTSHTRPGELRGKLAYMSPEQARGDEVDRRTDLFALGVIGWELCTGQRLFAGDTDAATLEKVMRCDVPAFEREASALHDFPPELATELGPFFDRALSSKPSERFESAAEMAGEIRRLQRLVGHASDPRQDLAALMNEKFGQRAEYLRAAIREGAPPLRSKTRKRSSMVEVAAAARAVTASGIEATKVTGGPGFDEPTPIHTTTSTFIGAPARHWGLWLLLPMIGAGLAVVIMTSRSGEEPASRETEAAVAPPAAVAGTGDESQEARMVRWHFDTTPPGATVTISGEVQPKTTPTHVLLPHGEDPVKVVLEKEGYVPTTAMLAPLSDQSFPYQLLPETAEAATDDPQAAKGKKKRPKIKGHPGTSGADQPASAKSGDDDGKPKFKPSPFSGKSTDQR